jgi:hypothetical protein
MGILAISISSEDRSENWISETNSEKTFVGLLIIYS